MAAASWRHLSGRFDDVGRVEIVVVDDHAGPAPWLAAREVDLLPTDIAPVARRVWIGRAGISLRHACDGHRESHLEEHRVVPMRAQLRPVEKDPVEDQDVSGAATSTGVSTTQSVW